jgi:hypothetical protein
MSDAPSRSTPSEESESLTVEGRCGQDSVPRSRPLNGSTPASRSIPNEGNENFTHLDLAKAWSAGYGAALAAHSESSVPEIDIDGYLADHPLDNLPSGSWHDEPDGPAHLAGTVPYCVDCILFREDPHG